MECGNSSLHADRSAADPRPEEIHELIRIKRPALATQESGKDKQEKLRGRQAQRVCGGTVSSWMSPGLASAPMVFQASGQRLQQAEMCTVTPSSRIGRHPP